MSEMGRFFLAVGLVVVTVVAAAPGASAHVTKPVGDLTVSLGWRDEPAFAGLANAVQVTALDDQGVPVVDPLASLTASISFGDATVTRPLVPGEPGIYQADVVPTQPGTYSFHIGGTLDGHPVDVDATCSDATFECVADATEVEFPAPAAVGARQVATGTTSDESSDGSSSSNTLALVALALSAVAVIVSVAIAMRSRRTGRAT
jgi:hypothetical protein